LGVLARARRSGGGGLAVLARNRRIMASSTSVPLPLALWLTPAPISMSQMSCRGSRRSRERRQSVDLSSADPGLEPTLETRRTQISFRPFLSALFALSAVTSRRRARLGSGDTTSDRSDTFCRPILVEMKTEHMIARAASPACRRRTEPDRPTQKISLFGGGAQLHTGCDESSRYPRHCA
jgi:hypothetical protein